MPALHFNDIGRLVPLGALDNLKFNNLALGQTPVAVFLNGGMMNKNILAFRRADKTVPLLIIEPLHSPFRMPFPPLMNRIYAKRIKTTSVKRNSDGT